ncbi:MULTISPECIES: hypothetical protein [unclassified Rhizobium]|uniref:hypothetical protein n=1 Tax=unclassified Rhizobium TaxID=2613769 RepID=UPI0007163953|nr:MULTISPECIES: hypothetical protein [unclassified Rhizobium]KQT03213.1 hypothetical protein ASG42_24710 [Rhizobium sp. Leaf391]KQU08392.1 hypothetical protein ASG68_22650 [Rhizobium sp. Leaf453]
MSNPEKAVRDAAQNFHEALVEAKTAGLAVTWPLTMDALLSLSVSETGKVSTTVQVNASDEVPVEVADKAALAAQKAADKVVEKAAVKN